EAARLVEAAAGRDVPRSGAPHLRRMLAMSATAVILVVCGIVLCFGLPKMDPTANALRPRNSQAYAALDEIKNQLNQKRDPLWLLVSGTSEKEVGARLEQLEPILRKATNDQLIASYTLPTALWPKPEFQEQNRAALAGLVTLRADFHEAAKTNGFAEN